MLSTIRLRHSLWILSCLLWLLPACRPTYQVHSAPEGQLLSVRETAADPLIDGQIAPYRTQIQQQMARVIGQSSMTMPRILDTTETLQGNFVADLLHEQTEKITGTPIDLALVTFGGLRVDINQGPFTVGDAFELMPFENDLVLVEVPGDAMLRLFDYIPAKLKVATSRLRLTYDGRQLREATLAGRPFDPDKVYQVAMSDYHAAGGDGMDFLKGLHTRSLKVQVRQVLIQHFEALTAAGKSAEARLEGRIVIR